MIEPIGASLLCSGTGLIFGCISLILSGTSLSQYGACCQPVLWRSPDS
jgi:hypothetical protein